MPKYNKGDALQAADKQLLERVKAEFLAAHGPRLGQLDKDAAEVLEAGVSAVGANVLGIWHKAAKSAPAAGYVVPEVLPATYHSHPHC